MNEFDRSTFLKGLGAGVVSAAGSSAVIHTSSSRDGMVDTAVLRAVSVRCYAAELYARMAVLSYDSTSISLYTYVPVWPYGCPFVC